MRLYQQDNKGQIRIWRIHVEGNYTIVINHGLLNGKLIRQTEAIIAGKAGRTIEQQVTSRVNSRINKQKAKGYRESIEEAKKYVSKNELNTVKPMLAQQFNKQKSVNTSGAVLQRKLDGNRMLVTKQHGDIIAYTRNGKPIKTLDHIVEQMAWLEEGQTVDGEVYKHGMALKDIRGAVAKKQESTDLLDFHIYDIVDEDWYKDRFNKLVDSHVQSDNIILEPYWYIKSESHTENLFNEVRREGYEGLMMRLDGYGYGAGKRSKGLLKIKYRYDAEYEVIDIETGKNGQAILVMRLPNGETVKGTAPGTAPAKIYVAENPEKYIGKMVTCSFAYLTEFGIPFHLTCDNWRD